MLVGTMVRDAGGSAPPLVLLGLPATVRRAIFPDIGRWRARSPAESLVIAPVAPGKGRLAEGAAGTLDDDDPD